MVTERLFFQASFSWLKRRGRGEGGTFFKSGMKYQSSKLKSLGS